MNRNEIRRCGKFEIESTPSAINFDRTERDYHVLFARFIAHTGEYSFIFARRADLVTAGALVLHVKVITAPFKHSEYKSIASHKPPSLVPAQNSQALVADPGGNAIECRRCGEKCGRCGRSFPEMLKELALKETTEFSRPHPAARPHPAWVGRFRFPS